MDSPLSPDVAKLIASYCVEIITEVYVSATEDREHPKFPKIYKTIDGAIQKTIEYIRTRYNKDLMEIDTKFVHNKGEKVAVITALLSYPRPQSILCMHETIFDLAYRGTGYKELIFRIDRHRLNE